MPPGASCGLSQAAAAPEANVLAAPLEDADPLAAPVANVLPAPPVAGKSGSGTTIGGGAPAPAPAPLGGGATVVAAVAMGQTAFTGGG